MGRAQQLIAALAELDPAFAELVPTLESARTQLQDVIHALRELGDCLIEIYGQSESQTLLRGDVQRQTLDDFGQHGAALDKVASAAQARASSS